MFIEVTKLDGSKVFINTNNVALVKAHSFKEAYTSPKVFCTYIQMTTAKDMSGNKIILVKEDYEEVKQMIMDGK